MRLAICSTSISLLLLLPAAAVACMRPQMDERAVQWSAAIVEARLTSVRPDVNLGQLQERRGALGALGISTTTYFYRVYQFEVTRTLDGSLKQGQTFPVIRLFSRVEPQGEQQPGGGCAQHLGPDGVGKQFLLLVRPLSQFKVIVPNGITPPNVKGAMWIVHLEPKESVAPAAMDALKATIEGVRAAEQQATPDRIDQLIAQLRAAPTDAAAGPSTRALEKLGLKVLPPIQQAVAGATDPTTNARLLKVATDLTPPEPIVMIEPQQPQRDERR